MRIRLKHIHCIKTPYGVYYYHRPTGKRLMAEYGTQQFIDEVAGLNRKLEQTENEARGQRGRCRPNHTERKSRSEPEIRPRDRMTWRDGSSCTCLQLAMTAVKIQEFVGAGTGKAQFTSRKF